VKLLSSLSMACAGTCLLYCVHLFIGIGIVELDAAFCPCVLRTKSAKMTALGGGDVVSVVFVLYRRSYLTIAKYFYIKVILFT